MLKLENLKKDAQIQEIAENHVVRVVLARESYGKKERIDESL